MAYIESPEPQQRSSVEQMAFTSIAAPFIAILLNVGARFSDSAMQAKVVAPLVGIGLIFAGAMCAVLVLCKGRGETHSLRTRGIIGLVLNGGILAVLVVGMSNGSIQRLHARHISAPAKAPSKAEDTATARIAQVSSAYLTKLDASRRKLKIVSDQMGPDVLDFEGVRDKEELQRRREVVNRYLTETQAAKDLVVGSPDFFLKELQKLGASPEEAREYVREWDRSSANQRLIIMELRDADIHVTKTTLTVLDILHRSWGQWKVVDGTVTSDDPRLCRSLSYHINQINYASQARAAAERKLANSK